MNAWSIRSLLNPVITRLLIYGVNPIDAEYILTAVENKNHLSTKSLEQAWQSEWLVKANNYLNIARQAEENKNLITAKELHFQAAQCWYAIFLINYTQIEDKKQVYSGYALQYAKMLQFFQHSAEHIIIDIGDGLKIPAYLHLPANIKEKVPCVVIFSGLGSCKEEMHTLAQPLIDRGIAVLVPDMPGNGENIYSGNVKCSYKNLCLAFTAILNYLEKREEINAAAIGNYGLCMGGGYAYHASSLDNRFKACVNFFPLLITMVDNAATPQWMKQGAGFQLQVGEKTSDAFMLEMKNLEKGALYCPYLFIHGKHDNWMKLDSALNLFDKAKGFKEQIIIDEEPVFSNNQVVTHTMPVGEQLHWLKHVAADWIIKQLKK
jgi:dienelactone hydrolase